jgi:hypothetical protein
MSDETLQTLNVFVSLYKENSEMFLAIHKDPFLVFDTVEDTEGGISPVERTKQGKKKGVGSWSVALVRKRLTVNPFAFVSVGRAVNNDIVLAAQTVSKFHAYFVQAPGGGGYGLVDAGSTMGTFLETKKLAARAAPTPVTDGSLIKFGEVLTARFLQPGSFVQFLRSFGLLGR